MAEKIQTNKLSVKHSIITKDNKKILIATGAAAFIVTFSLVSISILYQQMNYQNRVIKAGKDQLKVATESLSGVEDLTKEYKTFDTQAQNMLNGNPDGIGDLDGKNSKIILEALPASYNYPALTTSIEKVVQLAGLEFVSMSGLDDEIAQKTNASSTTPTPIEMPFVVEVKGSYNASRAFIDALQKSIRPIQVNSISITADQNGAGVVITKVTGKSYFQPGKNLNLIEETVQ